MKMQKADSAKGLDFAIAGAPFDTASSLRSGSRFSPNVIRDISAMTRPNNVIMQVNIMDGLKGGDVGGFNMAPGYIHPTYQATEEEVAGILKESACPIVLGGDCSITLVKLHAAARRRGPIALIHFGPHSDLRDEVFGQKYDHGALFRRTLEESLMDTSHSIQVGIRESPYSLDKHKITAELGMELIPAHKVKEMGLKTLVKAVLERVGDKPCFLTSGIDFIDPAYAPGTGIPEVGDFTSLETLELVWNIRDLNFVELDLVEVLPVYDHGEIVAYLATNIVFEYLSVLIAKGKTK